jgi:hypothetical protein
MHMRLACLMPVFLLLACVSPEDHAREQAAAAAARDPWWQIQFADENQCRIKGFQVGTDAFAQCVSAAIARQREPHRCTYCRSLD